ncbi:exodeoxyribonuclease VII large subunit [Melghirimyces algeriensis]|uniref:Exodeoxyribonuclease 7 large subunit n=1 Tax=Melghirimyces algeriensis TaxID=910412 RepID=A0A521AZ98_9BACL|nr:exodeoxyribonuclease VII large subunit [Melghirimyces algeriensis]SMO40167.1 Exodeoxyribonuclease VII large subunit [Melghirimyces algeriensis]
MLTVTSLVRQLSQVIEKEPELARVWVQGEISNFKHHARGHMYFTLKDQQTRLRVVMFAGHNRRLRFAPKDGDDVLIRGRVAMYERDGQVQLYATHMTPNGIGERYIAFQQLKEKLEKEGLFSHEHKKALPFLPRRIGVITSPHGAAVRDIITTIRRRIRTVDVLVYPVAVQGDQAPREIEEALHWMNREEDVDVIILGRGGGSLEELWAFNEESVAWGIYRSQIPVVSAVGHETDTTISDFVADVRAATPTAAAEIVAPSLDELRSRLAGIRDRLSKIMQQHLKWGKLRLLQSMERPVFKRPGFQLAQFEQRLDFLTQDAIRSTRERLALYRSLLEKRTYQLQGQRPSTRIAHFQMRLTQLNRECRLGMDQYIRDQRLEWIRRVEHLDALSPLQVMRRGYSLVNRYRDAKLVKSVKDVQEGDLISVQLSDGLLKCQVWGLEGNSDGSG